MLSISPKKLVFASTAVAGLVALLSLLDLVLHMPFNGPMMMDILFAVSALITCYLGWDAFREIQ